MGRIGIFGGSFNPPHLGHLQAVAAAWEELGLDQVLLIPAATPPHKTLPPRSPDAQTRLELTRLAVADLPWAEVSDIELRRTGPSYTVDTLWELTAAYPGDELVMLVGTDMFLTLHQWVQAAEICRLATIAFAARTDADKRTRQAVTAQTIRLEREYGARVCVLHNPVLELSSTTVRRMLAFGCAAALLPAQVAAEIARLGLYTSALSLRALPMAALERECLALLEERRRVHVLGCRETAVALARRYGCDETAAERAGLLHDVTKALPRAQQLQLCGHYGMITQELTQMQPQLLHAVTGALVAKHVFGESPEVCAAIRWHTTGRAGMTPLEKVLYLADYMEPTRDFPGVDTLREAVWRGLDAGLQLGLEMSIEKLRQSGRTVSTETVQALADLTRQRTRS